MLQDTTFTIQGPKSIRFYINKQVGPRSLDISSNIYTYPILNFRQVY